MINLKNLLYASLFSSFLIFQQFQAKAEQVFYPYEQSEEKIAEIKDHYNLLEKTILNHADTLKNPIENVIGGRTKEGYPILFSTTETNEDPTKRYDEKQGTFLVIVTLPKKEFGIKVRYHPKDNESNTLVVKFKRKTKEFESATFLRKENGKEKEQREIINEGKGIFQILDSVFEDETKKDVLGRLVGNLTDNFDIQPYVQLYKGYTINYFEKFKNKEVKK